MQEKLPSRTLFDLIEKKEVTEIVENNFSDEAKKKVFKLVRDRLHQEYAPPASERVCTRQCIYISDKSLADSAEALIGLFLYRFVPYRK